MKASVEPDQVPELLVHTDSDFASCPFTSRSTSGIACIFSYWIIAFSFNLELEEAKVLRLEAQRKRSLSLALVHSLAKH